MGPAVRRCPRDRLPRLTVVVESESIEERALADQIQVDSNRPVWVGAPVFSADGVNLYPVCVEAGDQRCAAAQG